MSGIMERMPAHVIIENNKYISCIVITNSYLNIRMPERLGTHIIVPKNGYVYIKNDSPKFAYVNGWLYDCKNKLEPLNIGTNCSTEQITKLWEAMQCL